MKNKIKLVVGDYSRDGHEKSTDVYISCNLTAKEIEKAYKKGVKVVGLDVRENVASEYQDSYVLKEHYEKLKKAGYTEELEPYDNDAETSTKFYINDDSFAEMFMFVAKVGNPDLEYELVEDSDSVNVGGYGLFQ